MFGRGFTHDSSFSRLDSIHPTSALARSVTNPWPLRVVDAWYDQLQVLFPWAHQRSWRDDEPFEHLVGDNSIRGRVDNPDSPRDGRGQGLRRTNLWGQS